MHPFPEARKFDTLFGRENGVESIEGSFERVQAGGDRAVGGIAYYFEQTVW